MAALMASNGTIYMLMIDCNITNYFYVRDAGGLFYVRDYLYVGDDFYMYGIIRSFVRTFILPFVILSYNVSNTIK